MLATELVELKNRRESLFKQLQDNPQRLHLAIEIKVMDDQIAESNEKIQADRRGRK
jgi:hypothetical protein